MEASSLSWTLKGCKNTRNNRKGGGEGVWRNHLVFHNTSTDVATFFWPLLMRLLALQISVLQCNLILFSFAFRKRLKKPGTITTTTMYPFSVHHHQYEDH